LLSIATWLPALGALLLLFVRERGAQRILALGVSLATLAAAVAAFGSYNVAQSGLQLVEKIAWVSSLGLNYYLGVDGINLALLVLTALMMPFAINATSTENRAGTAYSLLLLLETGIIGTFLAQDLILFYAFFEFTLVPTALLLGIWGGEERSKAAATFFIYTFAGSLFMLVAIISLYLINSQQSGVATFEYPFIRAALEGGTTRLLPETERLLFGGFFIAFAIKIALWPFHTWMPLLHSQTPGDGSVDIAAVLLKVIGGYGLVRFTLTLFPDAAEWAAPAIGVLAVIGTLYGAWVAYSQTDMKRLLAYSSVSHLSFVVLGIFALNQQGISGALLQLVNYGITTGALFLVVAALEARFGTRNPKKLGGLWRTMPNFGGVTLILVLASIGLPGLNGFVGEFIIMQGAWLSPALGWRYMSIGVIGVILAAIYMLVMYRQVFMGQTRADRSEMAEIEQSKLMPLTLLLIPVIVIGMYPNLILGPMQPTVAQIAQVLSAALASR
jgi:NADH-quinone oxidoreductase subunit M